MLDKETKSRIDSARAVLVGKVPDPKSQIEQITTALIYKFMDDMDRENEEIDRKATFLIGDLAEFAWGKLMSKQLTGNGRWELFTRALVQFPKSDHVPELFRTIFKSAYLPYRDVQTLNLFLREIDGFTYDHGEKLGDAFEYLLSILGSQGDAGQFRTPRHIIDFIVEIIAPKKNETILDPACGTSGFLISCFKYIKKYNSSAFNEDNYPLPFEHSPASNVSELSIQSNGRFTGNKLDIKDKNRLAKNIIGYDISPEMVRLSLVNMYLHGFKTPDIHEYDLLTYNDKWGEKFNVILANPPFMTPKGGIKPHTKFLVQANRSEVLFVDYIAEHLSVHGRAGIIVPEGIIFQNSNAYKALRKELVESWGLYAVVSLPKGVFLPYSGVKTSILFLDRKLVKQTNDLLFIEIHNDGFDLGAQRRKINKNDLPQAFNIMKQWQNEQKISTNNQLIAHKVSRSLINNKVSHNLTGYRYQKVKVYKKQKWIMMKLGKILEYEQSTKYIVKSANYNNDFKTPVLTAGKTFILGYTNEISGIMPNERLPVIIFDDFTTATKFVDFPFKVKSSAMKILHTDRKKACLRYLFEVMETIKFKHDVHKRYWISEFSKIEIPFPPLEVQKGIVVEIEGYRKVIDGAAQVIANWKPSIKTNHDWLSIELGNNDLFEIESGGTPSTKNNKYWNGSINWASMADLPAENFITKLKATKRKITEVGLNESSARLLPKNSVLISSRATIGRVAITKIRTTTNQGFKNIIIKDFKKVDSYFLAFYITQMVDKLNFISAGSIYKEFSKSDLAKLKILLPPISVQKEIAAEIKSEEKALNTCKTLIAKMQQRITNKIEEVWDTSSI